MKPNRTKMSIPLGQDGTYGRKYSGWAVEDQVNPDPE